MYGFPIPAQVRAALYFLGLGFLLGVVYDLLRVLRLSVSRGRALLYLCDVFYALLFAVCACCTAQAVHYGELRLYMVLCAVGGFLVYYVTLDRFLRRVCWAACGGCCSAFFLSRRVCSPELLKVCGKSWVFLSKNFQKF